MEIVIVLWEDIEYLQVLLFCNLCKWVCLCVYDSFDDVLYEMFIIYECGVYVCLYKYFGKLELMYVIVGWVDLVMMDDEG